METAVLTGLAALLGALVPVICKFIIDFFAEKSKADIEELKLRWDEFRKERSAITDSLQKQIFELRNQVIILQKENFEYVRENAELRMQIKFITDDNKELKERILELEHEVFVLRGERHEPPTAHTAIS